MAIQTQTIFIGETPLKPIDKAVRGEFVTLLGEPYYRIQNFDAMEPFFMSIVSSSDHWLFIASTGGLSAGRRSAEEAIFPYYTVDKLTENSENTGNKAIVLVRRAGRTSLWEPFSDRLRGTYRVTRNLYKNVSGTALVFEENNHDLGMTYRYAWRTSERFGFVKTSWLINSDDSACQAEIVDGIQNILPANVVMLTQNTFSALLDAYKRSELDRATGLAIIALNSTLTDLAEPSESLLATTVAAIGLTNADYLLSSAQLDRFRAGEVIETEQEIRGQRGAYFIHTTFNLAPHQEQTWHLVADGRQDSAAITLKLNWLKATAQAAQVEELERDIAAGESSLWKIVAAADGLQLTNQPLWSVGHFANVMFNLMRGGTAADQYWVQREDFVGFTKQHHPQLLDTCAAFFAELPGSVLVTDLQRRAEAAGDRNLVRLCTTYLPLVFSRRHGDPSRPWNRFSIQVKKPDGSLNRDYEGNWRDIFQNWEALAYAYPEFLENMIATFLNATTVDGYNPYRISYHGVDWELPEPGNPWSNIGYWSDHQIIYLLKLMETSTRVHPARLHGFLARPMFSYANVPYRIKPYADLLKDPYSTIDFDWDLQRQIEAREHERGADGKLVCDPSGQVFQASLAEKLLNLLLAKLVNFVPEGGIWMNTQRPEWNDANNALVGRGLSVVTLCYLRRYLVFCRQLFSESALDNVPVSAEVHAFYLNILDVLRHFQANLSRPFTDEDRRKMIDALGSAGSDYRWAFYRQGLSGTLIQTPVDEIVTFLDLVQRYVELSLHANKRTDYLYHSYNILHLGEGKASIGRLYEMLEGQVAILSSGLLTADESVALLKGMRKSRLYRADQHSYLLYPDRDLPGFTEKNCLTLEQLRAAPLLIELVEARDHSILTRDANGVYHFSGHIRNYNGVRKALEALERDPRYAEAAKQQAESIRALFEQTFHHDEFTGRSGTFFAYEGLGSVYWHMVAKLLLAVQETAVRFRNEAAGSDLVAAYRDIREGLSFNKTPSVYGAFPTDPYSHTPKGQGAKQPGMTGLVKELILTRLAELGLFIEQGKFIFDAFLLDQEETLKEPASFSYLDVDGRQRTLTVKPGGFAYTICQTPVLVDASSAAAITVHFRDGSARRIDGNVLDSETSTHLILRDGVVEYLQVSLPNGEG